MDDVMKASFLDELEKIAANTALVVSGVAAPASGGKPPSNTIKTTKSGTTMKPNTQATNYSGVHNQAAVARYGTAEGSKSVSPPPVKT